MVSSLVSSKTRQNEPESWHLQFHIPAFWTDHVGELWEPETSKCKPKSNHGSWCFLWNWGLEIPNFNLNTDPSTLSPFLVQSIFWSALPLRKTAAACRGTYFVFPGPCADVSQMKFSLTFRHKILKLKWNVIANEWKALLSGQLYLYIQNVLDTSKFLSCHLRLFSFIVLPRSPKPAA